MIHKIGTPESRPTGALPGPPFSWTCAAMASTFAKRDWNKRPSDRFGSFWIISRDVELVVAQSNNPSGVGTAIEFLEGTLVSFVEKAIALLWYLCEQVYVAGFTQPSRHTFSHWGSPFQRGRVLPQGPGMRTCRSCVPPVLKSCKGNSRGGVLASYIQGIVPKIQPIYKMIHLQVNYEL